MGIVLQNENEGTTSGYDEFVSLDTAVEAGRPRITIDYINNPGVEDNWTFHSQPVGRAGTGYVNDYNGNLVFKHDDLSMSGSKMPVSLNHVFNSNVKGISSGYGLGWKLNLNQRIVKQLIGATTYYVYTDDDGTKHYFEDIGTTLKDESGDLTLTVNADNSYTTSDKGGNTLDFLTSGYLHTLKDSNGNTETLSYNGTTLISVTDGAGRKPTLDANANGYLIGIIDPSNMSTSRSYTGAALTTITYSDGKYTT